MFHTVVTAAVQLPVGDNDGETVAVAVAVPVGDTEGV